MAKSKNCSVGVRRQEYETLNRLAIEETVKAGKRVSVSEMVAKIIAEYLKTRENDNG